MTILSAGVVSVMAHEPEHRIIPEPVSYQAGKGVFTIKPNTNITISTTSKELSKIADFLNEGIASFGMPALKVKKAGNPAEAGNINLVLGDFSDISHQEGYTLEAGKTGITIRAIAPNGIFYGVQTLLQLMPDVSGGTAKSIRIQACNIVDYPRFPYRGLHLDVSRHIFPLGFLKKYIDLLAGFKINTFHWHLTDDQGWRLEIKKYPDLTIIGSNRRSSPVGRNAGDDNIPYGGFYTQDDAREIVAYAASKYVNVIPEIEMPGHATAALAAYPNLGCTGGPYEVWTMWGINDEIFCAGNEEVFKFLEDVLVEVMEIFPSKYIHIGGDEAPKDRWDKCPKCQKRIADEGLKDSHELQSYFITRMEKFLNKHGRQIIGWDEILEGGLAPGATVMSWRGTEGGIEAARMGHDVIMTPTSHCYLDYYQGDPATEPFGIGGYNTLKNTYFYEPVPEVLTEKEGRHILGTQGNLWTEYIISSDLVEYMVYPRAIALAEINWSPKEKRNWPSFISRLDKQFPLLERKKLNFSRSAFTVDITSEVDEANGKLMVHLTSDLPKADIRYTITTGSVTSKENKYKKPFPVDATSTINARLFSKTRDQFKTSEKTIFVNKATGRKVQLNTLYNPKYAAKGPSTLTDGIRAEAQVFGKDWLGFLGDDADAIIDLGQKTMINAVSLGFLYNPTNWIFKPIDVEVQLSTDGINYTKAAGSYPAIITPSEPKSIDFTILNINKEARYVRVIARNIGLCPPGHFGEGNKAWLFIDEIQVNPALD